LTSRAFLLALIARSVLAVDLTQATVDAFDRYIAATEETLESRFRGHSFLGPDESPERRQRLKGGALVVQPARASGMIAIKGG